MEFPEEGASQEEMAVHLTNVEGSIETGSFDAVKKIIDVLEEVKKSFPNCKVVIQGDFNTFPEYFKDPRLTRAIRDLNIFEMLSDNHLELERTNLPTELNMMADGLHERELDYVVTDQSLHGRVKVLPIEDQELTLANLDLEGPGDVHFDPMLLFSDHRPIWMRVSSEGEKGESDSDTEEMTN